MDRYLITFVYEDEIYDELIVQADSIQEIQNKAKVHCNKYHDGFEFDYTYQIEN